MISRKVVKLDFFFTTMPSPTVAELQEEAIGPNEKYHRTIPTTGDRKGGGRRHLT